MQKGSILMDALAEKVIQKVRRKSSTNTGSSVFKVNLKGVASEKKRSVDDFYAFLYFV